MDSNSKEITFNNFRYDHELNIRTFIGWWQGETIIYTRIICITIIINLQRIIEINIYFTYKDTSLK